MKQYKKYLNILLALVFLFSVGMVVRQALDDSGGESEYQAAIDIAQGSGTASETAPESTQEAPTEQAEAGELVWFPATVEDDPVLEELRGMDLAALREVNPDVVGWIRIPDSKIDYPVVQGEDNDFYLKHTWQGNPNSMGSIFLDCNTSPDLTAYNTLIYGHNMNSGAMFASLRDYRMQSYYDTHPYVYLLVDNGAFRFDVFSAYRAELTALAYGQSFQQRQTREKFLQEAMEKSDIETGITPGIRDRILTLSTCSGAGHSTRWVVHARLEMVQVRYTGE